MENNYIEKIRTQYRNVTLYSSGVLREAYELISKGEVREMLDLMVNNDREVDAAIQEYHTQTHKVTRRPNKHRKGKPAYITEKLPRNKQQYINEVELFFLLGKPVVWKLKRGDSDAYAEFLRTWKNEYRLDGLLRKAKRLAGAETESAIVFNLSRTEKGLEVTPYVAARSTGYRLRPLFDRFGRMLAYAQLYKLKEQGRNVLYCDFMTEDFIIIMKQDSNGWTRETYGNPLGKIPALYFRQPKAWDGAVPRIEREEYLDSKVADTNNYFADPKAMATADVVNSISDPDVAGSMVKLTGVNSRFEYINPPQNSATRQDEKSDLHRSIFFDTFTPDLSYESIKGLGTLSGAAMHNALILGYMKRDTRKELYEPMIDRLRSVVFSIMKLTHSELSAKLDELTIELVISDPFTDGKEEWGDVAALYQAGLISLEAAVRRLAAVDDTDEEIERIKAAMAAVNNYT